MAKKTKKKTAARKTAGKPKAKKVARKPVRKAAPAKKSARAAKPSASPKSGKRSLGKLAPGAGYQPAPNEKALGQVEDYFAQVGVIALYLKDRLAVGETIHVHGHTTDLTQKVESIQIEHLSVESAKKGDSIGIKVSEKCRHGDRVFRVD